MSYSDGKVYAIRCTLEGHEDLIYVGSTTTTLAKRLYQHRATSKDPSQMRRLYEAMRELGAANFRIDLVEAYPCRNRDELRAREEYWRRELGADLNTRRAHLTEEEARLQNVELCRQWHEANRDKHLAQMKVYNAAQKAIGFPCAVCSYTATKPCHLKKHYATRKHQVAAMKAHLTTLFREARAAHHARTVATFQTHLTATLVATVAEREAYRSQLTA